MLFYDSKHGYQWPTRLTAGAVVRQTRPTGVWSAAAMRRPRRVQSPEAMAIEDNLPGLTNFKPLFLRDFIFQNRAC